MQQNSELDNIINEFELNDQARAQAQAQAEAEFVEKQIQKIQNDKDYQRELYLHQSPGVGKTIINAFVRYPSITGTKFIAREIAICGQFAKHISRAAIIIPGAIDLGIAAYDYLQRKKKCQNLKEQQIVENQFVQDLKRIGIVFAATTVTTVGCGYGGGLIGNLILPGVGGVVGLVVGTVVGSLISIFIDHKVTQHYNSNYEKDNFREAIEFLGLPEDCSREQLDDMRKKRIAVYHLDKNMKDSEKQKEASRKQIIKIQISYEIIAQYKGWKN